MTSRAWDVAGSGVSARGFRGGSVVDTPPLGTHPCFGGRGGDGDDGCGGGCGVRGGCGRAEGSGRETRAGAAGLGAPGPCRVARHMGLRALVLAWMMACVVVVGLPMLCSGSCVGGVCSVDALAAQLLRAVHCADAWSSALGAVARRGVDLCVLLGRKLSFVLHEGVACVVGLGLRMTVRFVRAAGLA